MTRYTKLGSRRELPVSSAPGPDEVDDVLPSSSSSSSPSTSNTTPNADTNTTSPSKPAFTPPPPPKSAATPASTEKPAPKTREAMLKRAKLFKLKAKKAKTPEAKKKFLRQAWDMDRDSEFLPSENGARGGGAGNGTAAGKKRPREGQGTGPGAAEADRGGAKRVRNDQSGPDPARPKPSSATSTTTDPAAAPGQQDPSSSSSSSSLGAEPNPWKAMFATQQAATADRSEARRLKRAADRAAKTKCFACRGLGHEARDCPQTLDAESNRLPAAPSDGPAPGHGAANSEGSEQAQTLTGRETVGICFRCGSTQHTLAKCRKPAPRVGDELPFATCFVCGKKGHLSSKCPSNKGRGVYPEGGCCKLCSSVDHLARDCPLSLRRDPSAATGGALTAALADTSLPGGGGADEDHFHNLARRKAEVEEEGRATGKAGEAGGTVGGKAKVKAKKVVSF